MVLQCKNASRDFIQHRRSIRRRQLDVAERLVGVLGSVGGVGHGVLIGDMTRIRGVLLVAVGCLVGSTCTQGLVGVRGLLGDEATAVASPVVVGRAAGAAAHAEGPEEQGGEGEDDGEPGCGEHVPAHAECHAVGFEGVADAGLHGGEKDGGGDGGGGGEEEG